VNSKTGPVKIRLGSPLQVYRDIPSDLAHVNSSSYVGVLSFKQPDGSERAKEIYIFPEELRGTGEGSFLLNQSQPNTESNSRMKQWCKFLHPVQRPAKYHGIPGELCGNRWTCY
jgi:hypothetical protein